MKDSPIVPSPGYVVLDPVEKDTRTASGLMLPEQVQEEPLIGIVLAFGGPVHLREMVKHSPVEEGDKAVYKKYKEQSIKIKGEEYRIVAFEDIIGVIKD